MISLGAVIESLVPAAQYGGYIGNLEITTESYSGLVTRWQDTRPIPTWNEVVAEQAVLEAAETAAEEADAAADDEFANSFFNGKTFEEISTMIDNALNFPDETTVHGLIDALTESTALKNILKKMASAIIKEGTYIKVLARNLAAALKKAKYIE